jgi:hypothetical protein
MTRTVKSETDDPKRALAIVEEQRNKGYNAWIEDQSGKSVDEESLKNNDVKLETPPFTLHFIFRSMPDKK